MSYYDSREWKVLRDSVVNRDKYTCQECGYNKENREKRRLSAHHIIPRKEGGIDHPENLVTLCNKCHPKLEGNRKNPRNPEDQVFEKVIENLSKNTLLNIVESEIKNSDVYFDVLVWNNNSICNKCFEEEYSFTNKRTFINCFNGDIETVIERLIYLKSVDFYKFSNTKKFGECKHCSYIEKDFRKPYKSHREAIKDIQKLESMLDDSNIDYHTDILYTAFKYLHKNKNGYTDYESLKRSFQYAIDYSENKE